MTENMRRFGREYLDDLERVLQQEILFATLTRRRLNPMTGRRPDKAQLAWFQELQEEADGD